MSSVVYPGQTFAIQVAGEPYEVRALTGFQQEQLSELIDKAQEAELSGKVRDLVRAAKECLVGAVGAEQAEKMWNSNVNASMALQIATAVFLSTGLSEDEAKN